MSISFRHEAFTIGYVAALALALALDGIARGGALGACEVALGALAVVLAVALAVRSARAADDEEGGDYIG